MYTSHMLILKYVTTYTILTYIHLQMYLCENYYNHISTLINVAITTSVYTYTFSEVSIFMLNITPLVTIKIIFEL